MNRFMRLLIFASAFACASHASGAVIYMFAETYSKVHDGSVDDESTQNNTSGAVAIATLPGYSCTTFSSLGQTTLTGNFVQSRAGDIDGFVYSSVEARFTIDSDMSYNAAGLYTNEDGYTELVSWLRDLTTDTYLFQSVQERQSGPVAFTVGSAEGYELSAFTGNLAGTLTSGHSYQWVGQGISEARMAGDNGAIGSGAVSLILLSVPEPNSFGALVTILLLLGLRRTDKRQL